VCEWDRSLSYSLLLPDEEDYRFSFNVDGTEIIAVARSLEDSLVIYDVVIRLLAAGVVTSVIYPKRIILMLHRSTLLLWRI
jgi:hypothetical protein